MDRPPRPGNLRLVAPGGRKLPLRKSQIVTFFTCPMTLFFAWKVLCLGVRAGAKPSR